MYLSRAELDPHPPQYHDRADFSTEVPRRGGKLVLRRTTPQAVAAGQTERKTVSAAAQRGAPRPDRTVYTVRDGSPAPETRRYEPLLERVTPGSCWQFRLTANPTRTRKDPADRWRGVPEALLSGSGAGTVAAGAGREARLCPDGGRFSGDPETDLSLPEERKAAGHVAGGDL